MLSKLFYLGIFLALERRLVLSVPTWKAFEGKSGVSVQSHLVMIALTRSAHLLRLDDRGLHR